MIMGGALLTKCLRVSQEEQDSPINDGGRPTKALNTGTKIFTKSHWILNLALMFSDSLNLLVTILDFNQFLAKND